MVGIQCKPEALKVIWKSTFNKVRNALRGLGGTGAGSCCTETEQRLNPVHDCYRTDTKGKIKSIQGVYMPIYKMGRLTPRLRPLRAPRTATLSYNVDI